MVQAVLGWPAWSVCHTIKGQNILSGVTWLSAGLEHGLGSCPNSLRSTQELFGLDEVQLRKWDNSQCCCFRGALSSVHLSWAAEKRGFFFFFFCSYCRDNTTPREWTAGLIPWTYRQNCLLSFSQSHCGRCVTEGLLTWGTPWRSLRASSDIWNLLILGTCKQLGKLWSHAPEPKLARLWQSKTFCKVCSQCNSSYT